MKVRASPEEAANQPCRIRWPILSRTVVKACESSASARAARRKQDERTNLHDALLVELNVCEVDARVGFRSRDARCDGDGVGFEDDATGE